MEQVINVQASEQFKDDYVRYALYVMYSRVTPDFRDGLKPIHRRILYAMLHDSKAINNTVKSATVVGDVMGKYHPHGDAAAYGAIKPMTNWFECKVPLVDHQGSFGNLQGNGASAARYTECKLSKFALECVLGDLIDADECVDWDPNFDNTKKEPQYLPCAVPLLLVNGTFAIGVGKKPQIPTHNLAEVIDATLLLMHDPNADFVLVPDHCMKCEIVDTDWRGITNTGYGYYTVRGVMEVEQYNKNHHKNRTALVIKSVPNLIFLNTITDKIDEMIASKKIIQIEEAFEECTDTEMRYVMILKPGADPDYVKNMIYKNTQMEIKDRINFEALYNLNPVRMNYRGYLLSFIDHRRMVKFRAYKNRLQKVQTRIIERDAFIKILESGYIDEFIAKLRKRKNKDSDDELIEWVIKVANVTTLQARYIINIPLKAISVGRLPALKEDMKNLLAKQQEYMQIITDPDKLNQLIVDELLAIKAKYGAPRQCKIISPDAMSEVPKGAMTVVFTEKGFVTKIPMGTAIPAIRGDQLLKVINIDNADSLLIFDNIGKVFRLPVNNIKFGTKQTDMVDIRFLIKGLTANIASIIPESVFLDTRNTGGYVVTLTKSGLIKKMDFSDFVSISASGLNYCRLENGDYVQAVRFATDAMGALIFSDKKAMMIPITEVPKLKRNTMGNKTFRNNIVDGMTIIPDPKTMDLSSTSLLVITQNGRFNKLPILNVPEINSVKKQFSVIKLGSKDRIMDIHVVNESTVVTVRTLSDTVGIAASSIPASSTISPGEKVFNAQKDKIIRTYIQ